VDTAGIDLLQHPGGGNASGGSMTPPLIGLAARYSDPIQLRRRYMPMQAR